MDANAPRGDHHDGPFQINLYEYRLYECRLYECRLGRGWKAASLRVGSDEDRSDSPHGAFVTGVACRPKPFTPNRGDVGSVTSSPPMDNSGPGGRGRPFLRGQSGCSLTVARWSRNSEKIGLFFSFSLLLTALKCATCSAVPRVAAQAWPRSVAAASIGSR